MDMRFPPRRILVPIDFSPQSLRALRFAEEIGKPFGAELALVHVVELPPAPGPELGRALLAAETLRRREPGRLKALERRLRGLARGYPGPVTARAWLGVAAHALPLLAARRGDLIVMGTHGRRGLRRLLYGSVAEAMMRRSGKPLLAARAGRGAPSVRRVLCPYNMRDYSARALRYAARLAWTLRAELTVLFAAPPLPEGVGVLGSLEREVRSALGPRTGDLKLQAVSGEPAAVIARQAKLGRFDLVVMAEHETPWPGAAFGTTAERLLRRLAVPILTVPATSPGQAKPAAVWPVPRTTARI